MEVHVCMAREVSRRRSGRKWEPVDEMVIRQVRTFGGYSVFFATSTKKTAEVCDDLEGRGVLVRVGEGTFPWIPLKVAADHA